MVALLTVKTDWNVYWVNYTGAVRVVLPDTSVAYGEATGETLAEPPGMAVLLDSGRELWAHPRNVWPIGMGAP